MEKSLEMRVCEIENALFSVKKVLNFEEASRFMNMSKSHLYKLTSQCQIPHYKPQGKMIYFDKEELEKWLLRNPIKTQQELTDEASLYIFNHPLNR